MIAGADLVFQVRGGGVHLIKSRRAEGGANNFGVFRVKNHDFTPKNHIFSNFRGAPLLDCIYRNQRIEKRLSAVHWFKAIKADLIYTDYISFTYKV